jgi:ribosomal-protein-serine acetyltransferase
MGSVNETYSGDGFRLTRWRPADAESLFAAVIGSQEHIGAWLPWADGDYTDAHAAGFLDLTAKRWESGEAFEYAIRVDGALAGGIGLRTGEGGVEIGYWLTREATGRGLMTRAVELLTAEAFRLGAGYVEIKHDEANVRSGAIPARLGFSPVRKEPAAAGRPRLGTGTDQVWRVEKP